MGRFAKWGRFKVEDRLTIALVVNKAYVPGPLEPGWTSSKVASVTQGHGNGGLNGTGNLSQEQTDLARRQLPAEMLVAGQNNFVRDGHGGLLPAIPSESCVQFVLDKVIKGRQIE
jgi:hypothetical protein